MKDERLAYLPTDEFLENLEHKKEVYPDLVESEAERGYFEAMCQIAYMYAKGMSVEQDQQKAFKWYLEAVEAGITNAQYNLGEMYYNGWGVEKNRKKAVELLTASAEHGFEDAKQLLKKIHAEKDNEES